MVFFRSSAISVFITLICFGQGSELPKNFGDIPLAFEENRGQLDAHVRYFLRGGNLNVFITETGATLTLRKGNLSAAVRMELIGTSKEATVVGESPTGAQSSFFRGNDPAKWVTAVRHYQKVRIHGVRNGVDLLYYANEKQFEYDLVVKPGVRPDDVKVRFPGAQKVSLTSNGELKIETAAGSLIQHNPRLWQTSRGRRKAISGRYLISPTGEVSIEPGRYDRSLDLVIDPVISYATYLGGSGQDVGNAIAVDVLGNAYITGKTSSPDFPTTVGAYATAEYGYTADVFVAKLNPAGTALVYSTYIRGWFDDTGSAIAVDSSGNAYITGTTSSANFPVTPGAFQQSFQDEYAAFVTKLNSGGNALIYSTFLGGGGLSSTGGRAIQVDRDGNAYIVGTTDSGSFPTTAAAYQPNLAGQESAFVTKVNPSGTALLYSTFLSGSSNGNSSASAIALNSNNEAYIVGNTSSPTFPTTAGAYQNALKSVNGYDAFISKLSADGSSLLASTYLGGAALANEYSVGTGATAVALDAANNPYVAGFTSSSLFPTTPAAFLPAAKLVGGAFFTKLNPALSSLTYSSYLGAPASPASPPAIAVDTAGRAYIVGSASSQYSLGTPGSLGQLGANHGAFLMQIDPALSALLYSTFLGGNGTATATGVAVAGNQEVYMTGSTAGGGIPATPGAYQSAPPGEAFVMKLDLSSPLTCAFSIAPSSYVAPLEGGSSSFSIVVPQGCPWNVASQAKNVIVNSPAQGFGSTTVSFTVSSNAVFSYPASLSAGIAVGTSIFSITQPVASCSTPVLSPATATFWSAGGPGSFTIEIPVGCSFNATSNAPWLTITSGATGKKAGAVNYSIAANTTGSARSGTITIAGKNFAITQQQPTAGYTCSNSTPPVIASVNSASAYGRYPYFTSGSWLEIKGSNLADPADPRFSNVTQSFQWTVQDFSGVNAPTTIDGVSVAINGKGAYVWYFSPGQINVQAPADSAIGPVDVTVTNCKATSAPYTLERRVLAPGLLAPANYNDVFRTPFMVATFASDGAYVLSASTGAALGLTSRPAKTGDVIIAYGIGFGDVTPTIPPGVTVAESNTLVNPVTFAFGSVATVPAVVAYAGLAGSFVGLYEFYITVPAGLGNSDYPVTVKQNGVVLPQTLNLTVHN